MTPNNTEAGKSKEQQAAEMRAQVRKDYTLPPAWAEDEDYLQIYAEWYHDQQASQHSREQPWVRVETALPEIGDNVIVYTAYTDKGRAKNDMFCGYMDEYGELFYVSRDADESYGWQFSDCVTHWKPLPPAPPIK